jgi:hypothetical protein
MESGARTYLIILATLFACIATLVRQFGVILPIAYAMALMLKEKPKVSQWIKYCIPSIITVGAYRIGLWWLAHIGSELKPYEGQQVGNFLSDILGLSNRMFDRIGLIIYYAAIFLLPLLVLLNLHRLRSFSIRQKTITGIILFAFCIPLIHMWNTVPCGNYVNGIFIGPKTIKHLLGDNLYYVSRLSHIIISIICFFCAVLLILNMIIAFKKQKAEPEDSTSIIFFQRIFIVFCLCGYSFLVFVFQAFFDRYLLLPIPLLFLLLISNTGIGISTDKRKLIAAYSIIILTGLITMLETHDYMEWNRSKWKALDYLTKECNISPHKIDGGYEFNGWYNIRSYDGKVGRSCVYVDDDEYIVTHNTAFNGYKIIKQFQYQNYFPFEEKTIYIFHRE